jgi:hypothetical protein
MLKFSFPAVKARAINKKQRTRRKTMKILMVMTSHDKLGNISKKTGFWLEALAETTLHIWRLS